MAGVHVPVIPLLAVVGKPGAVEPAQIDRTAPKLNVGATIGFTVTAKFAGRAHCPALGVNV